MRRSERRIPIQYHDGKSKAYRPEILYKNRISMIGTAKGSPPCSCVMTPRLFWSSKTQSRRHSALRHSVFGRSFL